MRTPCSPFRSARTVAGVLFVVACLATTPAALATGPTPRSVVLSPPSVVGGTALSGTVLLDGPAPSAGTTIQLASSNPLVHVPATITAFSGQPAASFAVTTSFVTDKQEATISATAGGGVATATLPVKAHSVVSLAFFPSPAIPGKPLTARARLDAPAPPGGLAVKVLPEPASAGPQFNVLVYGTDGQADAVAPCVAVPTVMRYVARRETGAGGTALGAVSTGPSVVAFGQDGAPDGRSRLDETPPRAPVIGDGERTFSPPGGELYFLDMNRQLDLALSCAPPGTGPITLQLSSSHPAFKVATSVTIQDPARFPFAGFPFSLVPVASDVRVTVTATGGPYSATFVANLTAPPLEALTLSSPSLTSSGRVGGTLDVDGFAPAGGLSIALSIVPGGGSPLLPGPAGVGGPRSIPIPIAIPDRVTVPEGSRSAAFAITATGPLPSGSVTVRATLNGRTRTATLGLVP